MRDLPLCTHCACVLVRVYVSIYVHFNVNVRDHVHVCNNWSAAPLIHRLRLAVHKVILRNKGDPGMSQTSNSTPLGARDGH